MDLFEPSLEELQELTSAAYPVEGLRALAEAGITAAVVKAGADGAYLLQGGTVHHVPALADRRGRHDGGR